jgi:hypothetical protein
MPTVFTKIGQAPTLRANAVDYHTLPEDKISKKYPEVIYWASKLKMLDCLGNNLYPLRYKWHRVLSEEYDDLLSKGLLIASGEPSNPTGGWACLEGDGKDCTVFHPLDSLPLYTGVHTNEEDYTFLNGAIKGFDDRFKYFCAVSGRFGVRISNPADLHIEDWVRFDLSIKNGMNAGGNVKISFQVNDANGATKNIEFNSEGGNVANYAGYQQDVESVAESVVEQKIPPPNAGFGDVRAFRFTGPIGYIGGTRSYAPSSLKDTRGLREVWGRFLEYGKLQAFGKRLNQQEGNLLYGYKHLPTCDGWSMPNGKKGVKVVVSMNGSKVGHWSLEQKAVASLDMRAGIQWDRLMNLGELYPPINNRDEEANFGIGHWQWGNNMGAIKRFGKNSTRDDITLVGGAGDSVKTTKLLKDIKDKLIGEADLAGENCGFTPYGLGRNMVYYLEAYERFYLICDPLKKKNVKNVSFLCPGVRATNSAVQYFWLGKPENSYLKRRPMYGPYAYQWRVQRHNRDRNGNGISEGFYSMGHGRKYSLLYDAPAVYGLYVKRGNGEEYAGTLQRLRAAKEKLLLRMDLTHDNIRNIWFGERGEEGTAKNYGTFFYSCNPSRAGYDPDICEYVGIAQALAGTPNFKDHNCPQDALAAGDCFDPCMSIRYGQGFFPGGKLLDMFGYGNTSINAQSAKNVRLVPLAKRNSTSNEITLGDEQASVDRTMVFRSPISTPHARITLGRKAIGGKNSQAVDIGGVTPCADGGSDHCNYMTPTVHLGQTSFLLGDSNTFDSLKNYNANVYSTDSSISEEE